MSVGARRSREAEAGARGEEEQPGLVQLALKGAQQVSGRRGAREKCRSRALGAARVRVVLAVGVGLSGRAEQEHPGPVALVIALVEVVRPVRGVEPFHVSL